MSNKRVSQLTPLTALEVQSTDEFLIVDVSARETKKITSDQLALFMSISGSVFALNSVYAQTASYILGSNVDGAVSSAIFATSANTASVATNATNAISAAFATSASYASSTGLVTQATSASFLIYSANNGTASFAISSSHARLSAATNFLNYSGGNNGTASFAMVVRSASFATLANSANTASYFQNPPGSIASASWADNSGFASVASESFLSYQLVYSPTNGTASYSIKTEQYPSVMISFGVSKAHEQTDTISALQNVSVLPASNVPISTMITAHGTIEVPYTASTPTNGEARLYIRDRTTGDITLLETTPISVIMGPSVDQWDSYTTGSVKMPFSLVGQSDMNGYYYVYVSASSNVNFISERSTSFVIDSKSDRVDVYTTESLQFMTVPDCTITWFDTGSNGPFTGNLASFNSTSSVEIGDIDVSSQGIQLVNYIWTLPNLTKFVASDNNFLTAVSAMSDTVTILSCSNCSLANTVGNLPRLPASLSYCDISANNYVTLPYSLPISLSYFDCSKNNLITLPALPPSLSYFDCSNNALSSVPTMPSGTLYFYCNNNQITSLSNLPDSIVSMSCGYNPISSIDTLPSASLWLTCQSMSVEGLPQMPLSLSYLDATYNSVSFTSSAIANICSQLVANGQESGSLNITNCGVVSDPLVLADIGTLQSRYWTVLYDT